MSEKVPVAVVGLGAMGLPIASNLAKAGYPTQAWNRSSEPREKAKAQGVDTREQLSDIDARVVLVTLPDLPQLIELLDRGLQSALKPGDFLVVMSTISPVEIISFATAQKELGITVIDAPMSGGELGAQEARLSIMVGGDQSSFDALKPIFDVLGKTIILLGPVGAGQLTKAANQIVVAINLAAIGEAVTLARRAGLDASKVLEIFSGGLANSAVLQLRRPKIEAMDFPAGGKSKFLLKDLHFAQDAATSSGTDLPVTALVTALYAQLIEHGDGELDHSAIIREIERLSN
jgi:2-hydroxy-3-oxopropionate reductase